MDKIIGTLGITLIIILPMILFYQRSSWTKTQNLIRVIVLTLIWFLIATPLHEISHMIGAKLSGAEILDYQLIPRYWKGDFRNAFVKPDYDTKLQEFAIRTAPYIRDLIIVIIGYLLLKKKQMKFPFLVGFIFVLFLLNSVYDISVNWLGYAIEKDGDLNGLSMLIGHIWTNIFTLSITTIAVILTYKIFKTYKGFPRMGTSG